MVLGLLVYAFYGYRHSRLGTADRVGAAAGTD
jgi:basic amino acid/polyamine antiporter, APA family